MEKQKLEKLVHDLNNPCTDEAQKIQQRNRIVRYFMENRKSEVKRYCVKYVICELLNHTIFMIQLPMLGKYLGTFWYGLSYFDIHTDSLLHWTKNGTKIKDIIFPENALCTFVRGGIASGLAARDANCVLPCNSLYDVEFVIVW